MVHGTFSSLHVTLEPPNKKKRYSPWRVFLCRKAILTEKLVFTRPDGSSFTVPEGVHSDGSSIPVILQPFLPSRLDTMEAGIYHDYLCRQGYPQQWCDQEYRSALLALNVPRFYSYILYLALRFTDHCRMCKKKENENE